MNRNREIDVCEYEQTGAYKRAGIRTSLQNAQPLRVFQGASVENVRSSKTCAAQNPFSMRNLYRQSPGHGTRMSLRVSDRVGAPHPPA